jgi:membrane protein required for colicin V production
VQLIDYLLLVIVGLSTVISLFRGFFREALSLGAWVLGLWLAWKLGPDFAGYLEPWISEPELRLWVVRFLIVVAALLAGGLIATLFSIILDSTGLSGTDRVIGSAFGFARGVLLAALLVMALELMGFRQATWWDESKLIPYAAPVVDIIRNAADDGLDLLNDQDENTGSEAVDDAADLSDLDNETQ